MFDELVVSSAHPTKTNKPWAVALSVIVQTGIVIVLLLIPLIYTEALPKQMLTTFLVAPPPPPPPPPAAAVQRIVKPVERLIHNGQMMAPTAIPKKVTIVKEEELPPDAGNVGVVGGVAGGVPGGSAGGVLGGIIGGVGSNMVPPPKPAGPSRIRVGGNVQQASLIRKVDPSYPPLAKAAHVSGTVVLHAIIAKDGTIEHLEYQSGPAMLMNAAMDAVRQWRYKPTILNGETVEVDTQVTVVFTLG